MTIEERDNNDQDVLTGIGSLYTLSATDDDENEELDRIIVKDFLNTLAEIALAVASRNQEENP